MATVTYYSGYSDIDRWPGHLLEGNDSVTLKSKTATSVVIKHGTGHDFENFTITLDGTDFVYNGSAIIDGVLTGVTIKNAAGDVILEITKISAASLASDVANFASRILGFPDGDGNLQRDGKAAWSQLLSGADKIIGTDGNDRELVGMDAGKDVYVMGGGDDYINGGMGSDKYDGGDGWDTLSFSETTWNEGISAFRGINVDMMTGKIKDCWGGTDTLISIEEIKGSRFNDIFLGSGSDDQFSGLGGADRFDGGGGNNDKITYYDDRWNGGQSGISANLTTGIIVDGFGRKDQVSNIEWVVGTKYNDSFVGSDNRDVFVGDGGVDSYDGKGNPNDSGEVDRIQFNWTFSDLGQHGINVDLAKTSGQIIDDGYGNTESCTGIEGIVGSNSDDTIKGDNGINSFAGADGKDTMTGRGGINEYVWWDINHFDDGDVITDFVAAKDKMSFQQSNFAGMDALRLENDLNADTNLGTFLFDNATDMLYWDANGSDAGQRYAIVKLTGVSALTDSNFELF